MAKELQTPTEFTVNPFYERLIDLRSTNRKAFDSISPPSKLALAEYEKQKRQAEKDKIMRGESDLPPAA
ncbi:MAG: hypothetical protein M3362_25105 [Acidobacteriota bacterium]|nr:hypothetical protein [Acidobacteriota bacterium]